MSKLTAALLAAGVVGVALFVGLYDRAFPAASIELRVSSAEAEEIARRYLAERGFDLGGFQTVVTFSADADAATYLQRTQGLERANQLMRATVPVWYWSVRHFVPLQKEEVTVRVAPSGQVLGFTRELEEAKSGAKLDQERARALAEDFVRRVGGVDLGAYALVDAATETRRDRVDHSFVWKRQDFAAGEADLRLRVDVQGDRVGVYRPFLKVPEAFEREFARERSQGQLLTVASFGLSLLLVISALVVFMLRFRRDDLRWRFALTAAGVVLVLNLLGTLNALPLFGASYPTLVDYPVFLASVLLGTLVVALVIGLVILLTGGAGESLARELYPRAVQALHDAFARRPTRALAVATLRGYAVGYAFLGYLVVFYLVGASAFGIWLPARSPYENALATYAPFLFPLLAGLSAAVTEEFTYRLFAVSLLKRYLRWTVLALLLPAAVWAFAHSTYQVFPVYVRGIELTIAGIALGYAFLRFGIWSVLVAHYVVNASIVGLPLLRSDSPYFIVSGAVVLLLALLPALPALLAWRRAASQRSAAPGF